MKKFVCPAFLVLAFAAAALAQNYTIQTFAVGGVPQNIAAVSSSLGAVTGIATDSSGNVYMALPTYSAVVKMDVMGALTLVAGTGKPGFSGDNGPATSAQLNLNVSSAIAGTAAGICQCSTPIPGGGLAVDSTGNLYIADSGNNRVRKVSNGNITTVAGNTLSLSSPTGVAVDSSGNLYIADTGNQVVRKVSGSVTVTVAGTGTAGSLGNGGPATAAQLNFPTGVAVSAAGNLYITDFGNDALRLVSGGVMTAPVFLTGLEPSAVTIDPSGNVFFTAGGFAVVEPQSNGNLTVIAGNQTLNNGYSGDNGSALSAQMNNPSGVAVDASGNLYIADDGNSVVRKVAGGIITTVAGSPQGFIGDSGPALSAQLSGPTYTATGPAGETYVVDSGHNVVRKVANGVITTVAGTGVPGYSGDNGLATSATLNSPWGVVVDASGNLYISDSGNAVIRKVTGGIITTIVGTGTAGGTGDGGAATSATLNAPAGMALDAAGNLYIADFRNNRVRIVSNSVINNFAGNGVGAYTGDGLTATSASLFGPADVKVDAAGSVYIADQGNNVIRKVAGGVISTVAGNGTGTFGGDNGPATSAQLNIPTGIALDVSGNLIIADTGNNVIRKVSGGIITTIAGNGVANYRGDNGPAANAAINAPLGVSANALGQIFIADSGNNLIRVMNPPCNFALTTSSLQATGAGGNFTIGVQTAGFCSWSVSGLPDWVTLASPASVTGPATVSLNVAAISNAVRSATITVAGISVTINQAACSYSISPGAQEFGILGGTGTIAVTAPTGCSWSATNTVSFVTLTGATSGNGNGTVPFQVSANAGGDRSGSFTVAGLSFIVGQQSATVTGLNFIGSMPHIAAEENWTTTFTLVNTSPATTLSRLSLFGDGGSALPIPLNFPQIPALNNLLAASIDNNIVPNATLVVQTAGPQVPPVQTGSAQLSATGATAGFAIFHLIPGSQEAVVPLETRNASSYLLAFDNTNDVVLAVAVANISAQSATIQMVVRDNAGTQIASGPLQVLAPGGHTSFLLTDQFPVTAEKTGTVEFDTPSGGQISVLGIRTTLLGSSKTLTTIPALANIGTGGGSIAHIAVSNGWQTTFVLVNSGTTSSLANLHFLDDNGNPLPLSVSFPQQGGAPTTVNGVTPTLAAGAMVMVQANGPLANPVQTGSAQLTTTGKISGFVIFHYQNGQEAVVPLESRNAGAYVLAFDNTDDTATGVAVNSVSTQAVNVPVIVRNDAGTQIASGSIALAANGHSSFTIGTDQFPAALGIRGTIEFDAPASAQIGALGIRIPKAHTFTTLPALTK
jgi:trimeric autotransporter adhesin